MDAQNDEIERNLLDFQPFSGIDRLQVLMTTSETSDVIWTLSYAQTVEEDVWIVARAPVQVPPDQDYQVVDQTFQTFHYLLHTQEMLQTIYDTHFLIVRGLGIFIDYCLFK